MGWLDSRVGKDEVGAGACDGVAEPGVDDSWIVASAYLVPPLYSTLREGLVFSFTYPQEAGRTPAEYPVRIIDWGFSPCRSSCPARGGRSRCALDVIVEAFYDVAGARLF